MNDGTDDSATANTLQVVSLKIFGEPASKARTVFVYALRDPCTKQVRYVGRSFTPKHRYQRHISDKSDTHKTRWIKQLAQLNLKPELEILDAVAENNWAVAEIYWINKFDNLTNSCAGGAGVLKPANEARIKMRHQKLGKPLSDDHRKKVSFALKGKPKPTRTTAHKINLSNSRQGIVITKEWRQHLSQASRQCKPRSASGYKGVCYDAKRNKYQAYIKINKKKIGLGRFNTAHEAAIAYNKAAANYGWPENGLNKL